MTAKTERTQFKYFNVLSIDYGTSGGVFSQVIVNRLQELYPKFLRDADLLVGSGFGAAQVVALSRGEPLLHYRSEDFRTDLEKQFGDLRLGELSKHVAIPAVVNSSKGDKLKIFHNFVNSDSDAEKSVVEVILQTSQPKNRRLSLNPAMMALTQALDGRTNSLRLDDIALLSVGDTTTAVSDSIDFQCKTLLLSGYKRISAELQDKKISVGTIKGLAEDYDLEKVCKWLKGEWL